MQTYDYIMLAVLLLTTAWGIWNGLAWQVASLASLVVSYAVALKFADQLAPYLSAQAPWNKFLAMGILYIATSLVIWLAFRMVSGFMERIRLKTFDRQLGGLFGAIKGVVLCVAITFFVVTLSAGGRDAVLASRSGNYISRLLHEATPIMPKEFRELVGPYLNRLRNELDNGPSARIARDPDSPHR